MSKSFEDYMFKDFKLYYPEDSHGVVSYESFDRLQLMINLEDGRKLLYDYRQKWIRYIRPEKDQMTEEKFKFEFSQRLQEKMEIKAYGQSYLAEISGVSQATINKYINCRVTPSLYNVRKLAKALSCSVDELLRFPKEYE